MIAYLLDAIMRIEHESANAALVSDIDDTNNRLDIRKTNGQRPALFLRHMINAEELVVA